MALQVGSRLGHYDVTALIGEGGMGQVYRATDTQLGRDVALKILPDAFAADPDRLARFQREAQVLASLNHPGIAAIYGIEKSDDTQALVLELVEGPTLADRIAKGPIPLDEALPIAKQIAEALEAAHEAGVIHRDLKPANIKVREDGTVKVLDFGLAKALDTTPQGDPSQSPTLTAAATQMGVILGTAAYMSPEQARGKPVDRRADIWAFGCVLFEMLTGHRAFQGEDISLTLADVMRADPAWKGLPEGLSPSLATYLRRCFEKDPRQRVRDIGDVRLALEGGFAASSWTGEGTPATGSEPKSLIWQRVVPIVGTGIASAIVAGLAITTLTRDGPRPVVRFVEDLGGRLDQASGPLLSLSPDGTKLAYAVDGSEGPRLYVRAFDQRAAIAIEGTKGATNLFWSPDGEWVGFQNENALYKVSLAGGSPQILAEFSLLAGGASWGADDNVVYGSTTGLRRVSADGGTPEQVTTTSSDQGELGHLWPQILPGGDAVLFKTSLCSAASKSPTAWRCTRSERVQMMLYWKAVARATCRPGTWCLPERDRSGRRHSMSISSH